MKNEVYIVVKEVSAPTIQRAIQKENKGEVVNVYKKDQQPQELNSAIGFYAPENEEE